MEPAVTYLLTCLSYGAFTLDVKSMLNENLGGILGGTQCQMGDSFNVKMNVNLT
jgi:hypothetical protein